MRPMSCTLLILLSVGLVTAETLSAHLPGEVSAEEILNGAYPFSPSPKVDVPVLAEGFAAERLGTVSTPGVHPRILISPEQLPEQRARLAGSSLGRTLRAQRDERTAIFTKAGTWEKTFHEALVAGEGAKALGIYEAHQPEATIL